MTKEIVVEDALQQAVLRNALNKQLEWEEEHNQEKAVEAIESLLEQV